MKYLPINGWTKERILAQINDNLTCKSVDFRTGSCVYRDELGNKCVVGLFIPDSDITSKMNNIGGVKSLLLFFPTLLPFMPLQTSALEKLQQVHDHQVTDVKEKLLKWVEQNVKES
jgi:hypothetical protein